MCHIIINKFFFFSDKALEDAGKTCLKQMLTYYVLILYFLQCQFTFVMLDLILLSKGNSYFIMMHRLPVAPGDPRLSARCHFAHRCHHLGRVQVQHQPQHGLFQQH